MFLREREGGVDAGVLVYLVKDTGVVPQYVGFGNMIDARCLPGPSPPIARRKTIAS